jgi:hypothetical protein
LVNPKRKNRFSEVVKAARRKPQAVTKHGKPINNSSRLHAPTAPTLTVVTPLTGTIDVTGTTGKLVNEGGGVSGRKRSITHSEPQNAATSTISAPTTNRKRRERPNRRIGVVYLTRRV